MRRCCPSRGRASTAATAPNLARAQAFLKEFACQTAARSDVAGFAILVTLQGHFGRVLACGRRRLEAFLELGLDRGPVVCGRIAVERVLPGFAGCIFLAEAPGDVAE